jgi:hypothetical protein
MPRSKEYEVEPDPWAGDPLALLQEPAAKRLIEVKDDAAA